MTVKKNSIELDSVMLIMHSAQSQWTFEEYMERVMRTSRIKIRKIGEGLEKAGIEEVKKK